MSAIDTNKKIIKPDEITRRTPTFRVTPMPENTNHRGDIFGGWLQSQMDLAGAVKAWEETAHNIATRYAETSFENPIFVGDIVEFYTDVQKTGRTSVTIDIDVWALRRKKRFYIKVASGCYTYVAINENREPVVIE